MGPFGCLALQPIVRSTDELELSDMQDVTVETLGAGLHQLVNVCRDKAKEAGVENKSCSSGGVTIGCGRVDNEDGTCVWDIEEGSEGGALTVKDTERG